MYLIWIRMGVNILFGSHSASKDKCLLLLPIFLLKAKLWPCTQAGSLLSPFQLGWQGSCSPGEQVSPMAWSRGQGAAGWPHTPDIVPRGSKAALLTLDHAVNPPSASGRQRSPSILGAHSHRQISSSVCFYHLNSNCDNKNGSPETFGVLMNSFSKSTGKKDIIVGTLPLIEN